MVLQRGFGSGFGGYAITGMLSRLARGTRFFDQDDQIEGVNITHHLVYTSDMPRAQNTSLDVFRPLFLIPPSPLHLLKRRMTGKCGVTEFYGGDGVTE
jgi:hypothetical protein